MPDKTDRTAKPASAERSPPGNAFMGDALRSVYQKAVEEQIPEEMLALLGKLD